MSVRPEVLRLTELGPLPSEPLADVSILQERQRLIESIEAPVSLDEATALAHILGPDDCYGLALTVVHLIESAPTWHLQHVPLGSSPWLAVLRSRLFGQRG
jgi:hypothetical protein